MQLSPAKETSILPSWFISFGIAYTAEGLHIMCKIIQRDPSSSWELIGEILQGFGELAM